MTDIAVDELPLDPSRWRVVSSTLRPWLVIGLPIGYASLLGGSGPRFFVFLGLLALGFGPVAVLFSVGALRSVVGPPPAILPTGVRLRTLRRSVTLDWSEITMVWIGYRGWHRYLCIEADPHGPHASAWMTRGRSSRRQLAIYLPRAVATERVLAAARALSGGAVLVADRGPDVSRSEGEGAWRQRRAFTDRPAIVRVVRDRLTLAASTVIFVPLVVGVSSPWNQPWWPGVEVAMTAPGPCEVFDDDQAEALGITDRRSMTDFQGHRCAFDVPLGTLTVTVDRFDAVLFSSRAKAADRLEDLAEEMGGSAERISDVGDEAWMNGNPQGTTTMIDRSVVNLAARRANVVLVIVYGGEREPSVAQRIVTDAARAALAHLPVR